MVGGMGPWLGLYRSDETDVFRLNEEGYYEHVIKCPGFLKIFVATSTLLICDTKVFQISGGTQCTLV